MLQRLFIVFAVAVLTIACSRDEPTPTSSADAPSSSTTAIDWEQVPLGDLREVGFPTTMRLLRSLDYWHGGQVPVVAVEIAADGLARDHTGKSLPMTPTEWKTMLEGLRRNDVQPVKLFALSAEAWNYDDEWGHVVQYIYEIEIQSPGRLVLTVLERYERRDR